MARICEIEGCGRPHAARGYCRKHWKIARQRGDFTVSRIKSAAERFGQKIRLGPMCPWLGTACWLWTCPDRSNGYGKLEIDGERVFAHRFAFEQAWPWLAPWLSDMEVDHACRVRACVNPLHLRLVTHKQNVENVGGPRRDSTSGVRGVWWDRGSWRASVGHNNKPINVGRFTSLADAEAAVIAKRNELFTHNDSDR